MSSEQKGKYQPWRHEEFVADIHVRRMTSSARKIYMVLLHEAFVCSTRPDLPDNDKDLAVMVDCDDPEEWEKSRASVLNMFEKEIVNGVPVLFQKRLREDWAKLQDIRASRTEAGRIGGLAKASKCLAKRSMEVKEVKEVSKEKEESEESSDPDSENPLIGQEDEMNLKNFKTEMAVVAARHRQKATAYDNVWDELMILTRAHSSQGVINDFEAFLSENEGAEFPKGALVAYQYQAADRLAGEAPSLTEVKSPALTDLNRELTYLSGGVISFIDKQKIKLAELLRDWTRDEIITVFKEWLADQDLTDAKNLQYLPGKFIQTADSRCYSLRRSRQEKAAEAEARQRAVERLQEAANAERREAERKRQEEASQFDPLADLLLTDKGSAE